MPPEKKKRQPRIYVRARCEQSFKDKVIAFAKTKSLSESDIVRLALQEYLERVEGKEAHDVSRAVVSRTTKKQAGP